MSNAPNILAKFYQRGVVVTVCGWLGVSASVWAAEPVRVQPEMIKPLMSGTSILTESRQSARPMTWHFRQDGRLDGDMKAEYKMIFDEGKWWTNAVGLLCFQWQKWGDAKKRCRILSVAGDQLYGAHPRTGKKFDKSWTVKKFGPQSAPIVAALEQGAGKQVAKAISAAKSMDRSAPRIEVPSSLVTKTSAVAIAGRVGDSSQIVEVSLDGRPIPVTADGQFSVKRGVPLGKSQIVVAVVDEWGNRAERKINVERTSATTLARKSDPAPATAKPGLLNPFEGIHFGAYHAVVVGNNNYRHLRSLKSARNDADTVAQLLVDDYGFKVTKLIDASRSEILGTLAKLRATLKPDDNLLIYYAGHGIVDSITEQGYWLPVDAEQQNPANWISNTDLTNMLRAIRARHVMVVADSCYSGTLVRAASAKLKTSRDKVKWAKRMLNKRGRTALVSGGLEPVVDSGTGTDHSVFAQAFIGALKENRDILEGQALFDRIKRPVALNADQTPQYSDIRMAGHEGGEFMFVRRTTK